MYDNREPVWPWSIGTHTTLALSGTSVCFSFYFSLVQVVWHHFGSIPACAESNQSGRLKTSFCWSVFSSEKEQCKPGMGFRLWLLLCLSFQFVILIILIYLTGVVFNDFWQGKDVNLLWPSAVIYYSVCIHVLGILNSLIKLPLVGLECMFLKSFMSPSYVVPSN